MPTAPDMIFSQPREKEALLLINCDPAGVFFSMRVPWHYERGMTFSQTVCSQPKMYLGNARVFAFVYV